ncbi:hypothetical protein EWI07_01250 [Sporolactobacillus sp. THM7-4]|nr:hypothetical protein EWI07_01250 [Sporolactobacillus sp. THM7-4]
MYLHVFLNRSNGCLSVWTGFFLHTCSKSSGFCRYFICPQKVDQRGSCFIPADVYSQTDVSML